MPTLPEFILESLPASLQSEFSKLQEAHQDAAVTSIRMHPVKGKSPLQSSTPIPWCKEGFYLSERPNFTADPAFHAGTFYVQEASSMFLQTALEQWVPNRNDLRVLDLCAAPGGKSTLTVSMLPSDSLLISNEVIRTRVHPLVENAVKWGYANHWVTQNDARDFRKLESFFDVLLVDAPCSGSGLFRKMPEYAEQIKAEDVAHCAARQLRIIEDALPCLKQDGLLVYMTCSFSEAENEAVLDTLCEEHDLQSVALEIPSAWGVVETRSEKKQAYGYRFFPHRLQGEGFFLAGLVKKTGRERSNFPTKTIVQKWHAAWEHWVNLDHKTIIEQDDLFFMLEEKHAALLEYVKKNLRLVKKGVLLGKKAGKDFIPDHELAMSADLLQTAPFVELDRQQALDYLKKEPLNIDLSGHLPGWMLVHYQSHPLGWIKNLGKRVNNYYPTSFRIVNKNIG